MKKPKQEKQTARKPYTMTEAAHRQRIAASHTRKAIVKDWKTTKVSASLLGWCKSRFGTANEALSTFREMMEGGRNV